MRRLLSRLLGRTTNPSRRPRPTKKCVFQIEALADRIVPAVSLTAATNFNIATMPTLQVARVSEPDQPQIKFTPSGDLQIEGSKNVDIVTVLQDGSDYKVVVNRITTTIPVSRVTGGHVIFNGYSGDDLFENDTSLRAIADGGAGADTLRGGSGDDVLQGGTGAGDFLIGNGGNDQLYAYLQSPPSNVSRTGWSWMDGGAGNDTLVGADGIDYMHGGDNDDDLDGRGGNDELDGGRGVDFLHGGTGDDVLYAARDVVGDVSFNFLNGEEGNDTLIGGDGGDHMLGGYGNDVLYGNGGGDVMAGEHGNDLLYGGEGDDRLVDFLEAGLTDNDWNLLDGGNGNDTLIGGNGIDYMFGGAGLDYLDGKGGNDDLRGGIDGFNDIVIGGTGKDYFQIEFAGNQYFDFLQDYQRNVDVSSLDPNY